MHLLLLAFLRFLALLLQVELRLAVELALLVLVVLGRLDLASAAHLGLVLASHRVTRGRAYTHILVHELISCKVVNQLLHVERLIGVLLILTLLLASIHNQVELLVDHRSDILELLVQWRINVHQSVVFKLVSQLLANAGCPSTDLISNQCDVLLACLQLREVSLEVLHLLREALVLSLCRVVVFVLREFVGKVAVSLARVNKACLLLVIVLDLQTVQVFILLLALGLEMVVLVF